jgi:hypothetical protein
VLSSLRRQVCIVRFLHVVRGVLILTNQGLAWGSTSGGRWQRGKVHGSMQQSFRHWIGTMSVRMRAGLPWRHGVETDDCIIQYERGLSMRDRSYQQLLLKGRGARGCVRIWQACSSVQRLRQIMVIATRELTFQTETGDEVSVLVSLFSPVRTTRTGDVSIQLGGRTESKEKTPMGSIRCRPLLRFNASATAFT